ncbi:valine--tRNA ligase [Mycoplasma sp. 1018B]|uniref:valine--tRNA ligase n=1 Tax=Mycoplasma sp. 1018B TaxID=2967302 RepID=UPI00211BC19A|nr:valine--tRNA ligase [Mycoplasma sp. 1018B]UUM19213.1 valine--tRNA ligase [Mycoplasma sp. 1018B]
MSLDIKYSPENFENIIAKKWIKRKYFSIHDDTKKPFVVLLPPPNVTGILHIGHAFDTYLQDTILRFKKMENYDTFYIAGMDHAGIATQSKIENLLLQNENLTKYDLGKEEFLKRVWNWKEEYAAKFRKQWQALGLSLDYEKERFTLDEKSNIAVNKTFIDLYNQNLIYRDVKAINWDVKLKTAISNIEIVNKSVEQEMLYIKYYLENSSEYLTIATTRPETLLSDVAVVYNPKDHRYKNLLNVKIIHPITKKIIPLIADEYVDINFGSGLMKLSAHSEIDIDLIKKHNLEIIETINQEGLIISNIKKFNNLNRENARKVIKEYLEKNNLLLKAEKIISNVGYSERSDTPIEILVRPQWFVKMKDLSEKLLNHLDSSDAVNIFPSRFKETLIKWMENAHDWTISRQLWWGHQIPAWYKDDQIKVQIESPGEDWKRDEDVLDTWFSSALTPFSFLGWPTENKMLERYFPTNLLVTGYDIIFFWVARMYFLSLKLTNKKPFENILIHGLVRDQLGRKMSKSLNNGVDPMDLIKEYGSDSLRWYLVTNSTPGLDINFSTEGLKKSWNFANKIWNIARFIENLNDEKEFNPADQWIRDQIHELRQKIIKAMNKYELTIIGAEIEKFVNDIFSSRYIEVLKVSVNKKEILKNFKKLLIILHPFMPFLTDYLFETLYKEEILEQNVQKVKMKCRKRSNHSDLENVFKIVDLLRKYRETKQISKKDIIYFYPDILLTNFDLKVIYKLANAKIKDNRDFLIAQNNIKLYILMNDEQKNNYFKDLNNKIDFCLNEITRAENILKNEQFLLKAPKNKILEEQNKLKMYKNNLLAYQKELDLLKGKEC